MVKCDDCSIWFCNGQGRATSAHIINHLAKSGHRCIDFSLKKNKVHFNGCNLCGSRNIFSLGFISSNKNFRYLLCRPPCTNFIEQTQDDGKKVLVEKQIYENFLEYFKALNTQLPNVLIIGKHSLNADNSDTPFDLPSLNSPTETANIAKWKPLIDSTKHLINCVLQRPDRLESTICNSIDADEINKKEGGLEDVRNAEKNAKRGIKDEDLIRQDVNIAECKLPTRLFYENGKVYRETFSELLRIEIGYERSQKKDDEEDIGSKVVFSRMCKTLRMFETNEKKINEEIYKIILGKRRIMQTNVSDEELDLSQYSAPNLNELNQSQALALQHAVNNSLTLVQGKLIFNDLIHQ